MARMRGRFKGIEEIVPKLIIVQAMAVNTGTSGGLKICMSVVRFRPGHHTFNDLSVGLPAGVTFMQVGDGDEITQLQG